MSSKLSNLFQTQTIFLETRKRYSFTSVKLSINTIHFQAHPMYQSRHKLSLKQASYLYKWNLLGGHIFHRDIAGVAVEHPRATALEAP